MEFLEREDSIFILTCIKENEIHLTYFVRLAFFLDIFRDKQYTLFIKLYNNY
jgi:hypothetical protein